MAPKSISALVILIVMATTQALAADARSPGDDRELAMPAAQVAGIGCAVKTSWSKSSLLQECRCPTHEAGETFVASPGPTVPMDCRQRVVDSRDRPALQL